MKTRRITTAQLANLAGITPRHVQRLAGQGVLPKASHNRHPTVETLRALFTYFRRNSGSLRNRATAALLRERVARAEAAELDLTERRGNLVPPAAAAEAVGGMLDRVGTVVRAIPEEVLRAANPAHPEVARAAYAEWLRGFERVLADAKSGMRQ